MSCRQDQHVTDEEGAFAFGSLAPGRYTIAAEDATTEGGAGLGAVHDLVLEAGASLDDVHIELRGGHRIFGEIVDSRGVASANVGVWFYDAEGRLLNPITATRTDEAGRFATGRLPRGEYRLFARNGSESMTTAQAIRGDDLDVQGMWRLERSAMLRVETVDHRGAPLRAQTRVTNPHGLLVTGLRAAHDAWSFQDHGMDSFSDLVGPVPPGEYEVIVQGATGATARRRVVLTPDETHRLTVEIEGRR